MGPVLDPLYGAAMAASSALVASVWQGMLLAGGVAVCLRMIRGLNAAVRSAVWLAVFVLVAGFGWASPSGRLAGFGAGNGPGVALDARWAVAVAAVWVALSVIRGVRLMVGAVRLAGIARRATPLDAFAGTALARRGPVVCSSAEVDRPGVFGFLAPRIVLPEGLCERLSAVELEAVVLHEREHLRRRDHWTNLLQKVGLAVMPLNPVLAWVERRLCRERELACDDAVLRQTTARKAYAACLTHLAEERLAQRPLALVLGLAGRGSELTARVRRILAKPEVGLGRGASVGVSGALMLVVLGGGVELARSPRLVSFVAPREIAAVSVPGAPATGVRPSGAGSLGAVGSREVKAAVTFRDEAGVRQATVHVVRHGVPIAAHARVLRAVARVDVGLPAREGWVVLAGWSADGGLCPELVRVRLIAPAAEVSSGSSYASAPYGNGWLVFQL